MMPGMKTPVREVIKVTDNRSHDVWSGTKPVAARKRKPWRSPTHAQARNSGLSEAAVPAADILWVVAVAYLVTNRRRRHPPNAAHIEILRIPFIQKLDCDPIDTTRICQAVSTMAGLGNNDMSAVR